MAGKPRADADFWKDRSGNVFVRLTSQGYVYHCQAMQIDGKQLSVHDRKEFDEFITGVLHDWMIQGVDDSPEGLDEHFLKNAFRGHYAGIQSYLPTRA